MRDAALYGVLAAFCTGLTSAPFALDDLAGRATVRYWVEVVATAGITAALGWKIFHHRGRQPSGWGYCLLGALVVLVTHVIVFAQHVSAADLSFVDALFVLAFVFIVHVWFTVPAALLATFVFAALRRR